MSDITPAKRTVWDIPVPDRRRARVAPGETPPAEPPSPHEMKRPRSRFGKKFIFIGVAVLLVALGLLGREMLRVQAVVTVAEKKKSVSIDGTFIAKKETKTDELPFEVISATKEVSKNIPATGESTVETKASGTIVIYNNFSEASQRLIKNTRFETLEGLIYRIDQSVTVPGRNKDTGTPGSVEALVYADAAGKEYNIGLSDFTIPGFKGDVKYTKFFARSKTPMTGGFVGKVKTASPEEAEKARTELRAALREELAKNIQAQVPAGFVLFDKGVYLEFESLSPKNASEVKEKAVAYGVLFSEKKLSAMIAAAALADYDRGEVVGTNLNTMAFTPIPADARPWQTGVVSFSLKGTTTLTWVFDAEKLRSDLVGQPKEKARIATILQAYPSIDHAEVVVRPFWRTTLPDDVTDISVVIGAITKP